VPGIAGTVALGKSHLSQEDDAMPKAKPAKAEKLTVKIVVEITGHMPKGEVEDFMAALSSVVDNKLENGGNGGA
jgi:hypothetical protein